MVEIRFQVDTPLSPQQVRAAATDFSKRRPQIWSGIDPKHFTVHALGDRTAEVTEGGHEFGGIWAREHYDWSDPDRVVARVLDSNIFRPGSRWELRVRPTPTGGSRVEWTSLRRPSSLKGHLVVLVLRGRRPATPPWLSAQDPIEAREPDGVTEHGSRNAIAPPMPGNGDGSPNVRRERSPAGCRSGCCRPRTAATGRQSGPASGD
jgi:hypothetical protein